MAKHLSEILQTAENEWITFPGGELEGRRPRRLCPSCRARLHQAAHTGRKPGAGEDRSRSPLCFRCYREDLDRQRALKAAGELDTATEPRFQFALPLEPVDQLRLAALKVERATARAAISQSSTGRFIDRRREAQIAARHALQAIGEGLRAQQAAVHAAELQLPESWLPFVVAR